MTVTSKKIRIGIWTLGIFAGFCGISGVSAAQEALPQAQPQAASSATLPPELLERFTRLEAETQQLRQEVARLNAEKETTGSLGAAPASPIPPASLASPANAAGTSVSPIPAPITATDPAAAAPAAAAPAAAVPAANSEVITGSSPSPNPLSVPDEKSGNLPVKLLPSEEPQSQEEVMTRAAIEAYIQKQIQENAWKVGPMKLTPYGKVWATMLVTTSRTAAGDLLGRVLPSDAYGQTSVNFQARTSRLGLKASSPDLELFGGVKSSGIVEFDFRNSVTAENKGAVCLREAYWQIENEKFKFLFGQTKDVISPLFSSMFDYNALLGVGNVGYRNPMMSYTRYYQLCSDVRMEVTSALVMLCGSDYSSYDSPGSYPTFQGRVGWVIDRPELKDPIRFGIAGHVGEQCYDFPSESDRIRSWSVDMDLIFPITDRFRIRSELFTGQGLAGVYGGVSQSIDFNPTTRMGTRKSIHSSGGWAEIVWDWTEKMQYRMGYSMDDPDDSDMEAANVRLMAMAYSNIIYDFTKYLRMGLQYSYTKTDYRPGMAGGEKGRSHGFEWMWQVNF